MRSVTLSVFTLSLQISRDNSVQTVYWFPSWSLGTSRLADTLYREVQATYSNMLIIRSGYSTNASIALAVRSGKHPKPR